MVIIYMLSDRNFWPHNYDNRIQPDHSFKKKLTIVALSMRPKWLKGKSTPTQSS